MDALSIQAPSVASAGLFDRRAEVRVAFLGRLEGLSTAPSTADAARRVFDAHRGPRGSASGVDQPVVHPPVVNQQVHSDRVVDAADAPRPADGLFDAGARPCGPLTIFTADCVPVLLGRPDGPIAALHAGWRGLASGIVGHGVALFDRPAQVTAWIGPCIGACCYEVDHGVALSVAATCDGSVIRPGNRDRPHLDLERAARLQLEAAGIRDVRILRCCTRCNTSWHSYRREGPGQGRNHAFIWRDR